MAFVCGHQELFESLCYYDPLTLEQYLLKQKQGFYAFRFFKVIFNFNKINYFGKQNKTEKYTILIDDKIPCLTNTSMKQLPLFARSADPNEFWVSLIEKVIYSIYIFVVLN